MISIKNNVTEILNTFTGKKIHDIKYNVKQDYITIRLYDDKEKFDYKNCNRIHINIYNNELNISVGSPIIS